MLSRVEASHSRQLASSCHHRTACTAEAVRATAPGGSVPARTGGLRFTGADAVNLEHTVVASSGDLACTVGFERSHVSIDGGPPRDMTVRVTHIYRRIDGEWKLMHRHADFPPPDQRITPVPGLIPQDG